MEEHFRNFGDVIKFNYNEIHRGGFVVFGTLQEAQRALETSEHVVDGCVLGLYSSLRDLSFEG